MRPKALRGEPVDVVLVDRQNYHLFTPLLYQVASCLLNPSEIAAPLRKVVPRRAEHPLPAGRGRATSTSRRKRRAARATATTLEYDELVLATGSVTNYFGNDAIAEHALGLKDLGEALQLRNHVLECLERADARRPTPTSGGGCSRSASSAAGRPVSSTRARSAELVRLVLPHEYPELSASEVRIILLEGGDRLLPTFKPKLSGYARRELERRGVDGAAATLVASADRQGRRTQRRTRDRDRVDGLDRGREAERAHGGGTRAAHARRNASKVDDHLRIARRRTHVYAIGDVAAAHDKHGSALPMMSPPAMQAGRYVAQADPRGRTPAPVPLLRQGHARDDRPHVPRSAEIGPLQFTGFIGWLVWLVVHLYYLIGFENRLLRDGALVLVLRPATTVRSGR